MICVDVDSTQQCTNYLDLRKMKLRCGMYEMFVVLPYLLCICTHTISHLSKWLFSLLIYILWSIMTNIHIKFSLMERLCSELSNLPHTIILRLPHSLPFLSSIAFTFHSIVCRKKVRALPNKNDELFLVKIITITNKIHNIYIEGTRSKILLYSNVLAFYRSFLQMYSYKK